MPSRTRDRRRRNEEGDFDTRRLLHLALAAAVPVVGLASACVAPPASTVELQLLSFNDYHGHLEPPTGADATLGAALDPSATPVGGAEFFSVTGDVTRAPNRDAESSLANLIADAQLAATSGNGAQIALMNPGGVRADLIYSQISGGESAGEVTFGEAFTVQPFGNLLVTLDMTGAQIDAVLEQQYIATRSRPTPPAVDRIDEVP